MTYAGYTEHGRANDGGGKVTELNIVDARVISSQGDEQQLVLTALLNRQTLAANAFWKPFFDPLDAVLHLDSCHLGVGSGLERQVDLSPTFGAGGSEVEQPGNTVEFALNHRRHGAFRHLRRRAGIGRFDADPRRRDVRVLLHRQLGRSKSTGK